MNNHWFIFASIVAVGLSSVAVSQPSMHPLLVEFPDSVLFATEVKRYQQVDLVAGKIIYQNTEGEDEGYLASSQVQVVGESHSYLNDYSTNNSALHLYQEVIHRLQAHNFELVYQCAAVDCGDVSGWQLYLSGRLEGDELSQHYVLARQQGYDNNSWFIQFYAIDLDGEPRTFLNIINARSRPRLTLSINENLLAYPDSQSGWALLADTATVLFDVNQSQLSPQANDYIASLARVFEAAPIERLVLTGHTDNLGSVDYNNQLARERALAVANAFKQFDSLNTVVIETASLGKSKPVSSNSTAGGRQKNRRVAIAKVLSPSTSTLSNSTQSSD